MPDPLQAQIDYHAARAMEELGNAESSSLTAARNFRFELSRLHLDQAGRLISGGRVADHLSRGETSA